jgi:hypothetical protein
MVNCLKPKKWLNCFICFNNNNSTIQLYVNQPCTGTRIRTQIKGFGDPYATIAPCPCIKPLAVSFQQSANLYKNTDI